MPNRRREHRRQGLGKAVVGVSGWPTVEVALWSVAADYFGFRVLLFERGEECLTEF